MVEPLTGVPVNVITGALGVGKTTALLELLSQAPANERWAVLINEFGEVGIDGAVVSSRGGEGLIVREVAGGCICCTAGLELRMGLVRLLREVRPDRLLIEPSGVAHPAAVIDALRSPGLAEAVELGAVIALVDPRAYLDPVRRGQDAYSDQVLLADVLVANRADECTVEQLEAFKKDAASLFPPKVRIETTSFGRLHADWLRAVPSPRGTGTVHGHDPTVDSHGWIWPPEVVFDRFLLEDTLQSLLQPNPALPDGIFRLKGVFRTSRVVLLAQGTATTLRFEALNWRRDSRLEVLSSPNTADWGAVQALLQACHQVG